MAQKNILIAYATRYGSTRIIAGEVADFLREKGHKVDVADLRGRRVQSPLTDYDMIVAGSSIAMFSWIPRVKMFLRKCKNSGVPTAVFVSSGLAARDAEEARTKFLDKVIDRIGLEPIAAEPFGPVIDFRPGLGMPEVTKKRTRETMKAIAKDKFQEDGLMDLRDTARFEAFLGKLTEAV